MTRNSGIIPQATSPFSDVRRVRETDPTSDLRRRILPKCLLFSRMKPGKRGKRAESPKTAAAIKMTEVTENPISNLTAMSQKRTVITETITTAETEITETAAEMAPETITVTTAAEMAPEEITETAAVRTAETARTTEITVTDTGTEAAAETMPEVTTAAQVTDRAPEEITADPETVEMEQVSLKNSERIDDLQRAGLRIIQDPERFCFGMDAVLLSHFASCPAGGQMLDLGTGTGIIPILMSALSEASHLTGLEIQEESADMADRSVSLNDIGDRVSVVKGDIKEAGRIFPRASFDCITCNPPYLQGDHGIVNPADAKAIARHEVLCTLEDVVSAAETLLKPNGHFFMVHRPFRLSEIMCCMHDHNLEPKRMRLVYPMADREPNMVLIEGIRGAKMRITVEKPLILQNPDGSYTDEVRELYGF